MHPKILLQCTLSPSDLLSVDWAIIRSLISLTFALQLDSHLSSQLLDKTTTCMVLIEVKPR